MAELHRPAQRVFRGIAVSPGVARGKILVLVPPPPPDGVRTHQLPPAELAQQVRRFEEARARTREQILDVQRQVSLGLGAEEATIFDAQLLVLDDPTLLEEVHRAIFEQEISVEYAFQQITDKHLRAFSAIEDSFMRERAADLRDVADRLLGNLLGRTEDSILASLPEPCIVVAHDLAPSRTAQLDKKKVLGFVTDVGGRTSHTAIMARSMGLPAVVGLRTASQELRTGEEALLDGFNGVIITHPTDQTLFEYGQLSRRQVSLEERLREERDKPCLTLDGTRITLSANVEQASDTEAVIASGAEGVGLFRTEFLFINRKILPDEEEQYRTYRQVAAALRPHPCVIRTLDLGGDKFINHLPMPQEVNPFLGWRAIRFCLQQKDMFRAQLRAILRASVEGNLKMMYPMISGLDELNQANALVEEYKAELRREGVPYNEQIEIGAMIEIPSAALAADALARRVKFFSVGTNDLIQYTLAVDRMNEKIAHLYEPTHPSILRLIQMTAEAGARHGLWTGVCGEMASDPVMVPLLIGLGVNELSVAPPGVAQIKYLIRRIDAAEARALARSALTGESAAEIHAAAEAFARKRAPALFEGR